MAEREIVAQVSFVGTLFSDGTVRIMEGGTWFLDTDKPQHYTEWHKVEGTCDPEELAYVTVQEMTQHT